MDTLTMSIVALVVSCVSLLLAGLSYWRTGGERDAKALRDEVRRDIESLHERQRLFAEEAARRLRSEHERLIARAGRARARIKEAREEAKADVATRLDALDRRLAKVGQEAQAGLERMKQEASAELHAEQIRIARAERMLEGELQLLVVKSETRKAESLASRGEFIEAEMRLQSAVARTGQARALIGEDSDDDHALEEVQRALYETIQRLRAKADTYRQEVQHVVQASDALIESLEIRERQAA
jgi:hypothetical protein